MGNELENMAYDWVHSTPENVDIRSEWYCESRDVFQSRLDRMMNDLLKGKNVQEGKLYIASAIAGEIGNNSFDHNLGNWADIVGVFFGYEMEGDVLKIVLADRGRGVLSTLRGVKPELENDVDALRVAFTERISGRAPENRGNGLKFVRENLQDENMHLVFFSGSARAELNEVMDIHDADTVVNGCLAILTV
ncbi:MAG: hypothetical protein WCL23_02840 [Candidatus Moraniibacteriota bacterium]